MGKRISQHLTGRDRPDTSAEGSFRLRHQYWTGQYMHFAVRVRLNPNRGFSNMDHIKRFGVLLIILWVLPMTTVAQGTGASQNSPPPLGKLVDVGGYRVHLYCTGSGSPTVVIVGAGFSFDWVWFNQKSQTLLRCAPTTIPETHGAMMPPQTHVR